LEGTVTYRDTGKPVPNARLQISAAKAHPAGGFQIRSVTARADASGRYRAVPYEGDSYFIVASPPAGAPYLLASQREKKNPGVLTKDLLGVGPALSQRYYPDGLVTPDLKPDVVTHRVEATLRRGVTLKGRVLGPDGQAVARGQLFCRTYVATGYTLNGVRSLPLRDGRFELPGWDPAD